MPTLEDITRNQKIALPRSPCPHGQQQYTMLGEAMETQRLLQRARKRKALSPKSSKEDGHLLAQCLDRVQEVDEDVDA